VQLEKNFQERDVRKIQTIGTNRSLFSIDIKKKHTFSSPYKEHSNQVVSCQMVDRFTFSQCKRKILGTSKDIQAVCRYVRLTCC
jgi:hypothetical protein